MTQLSPHWLEVANAVHAARAELTRGYYAQRPGRRWRFLRQHAGKIGHIGAMAYALAGECARLEAERATPGVVA